MFTAVSRVGTVREFAPQLRPLEDGPEHLSARLDQTSSELHEELGGVVLLGEDGADHGHPVDARWTLNDGSDATADNGKGG